jgi:spermidine synthase
VRALFTLTIFLGSFLLFLVQPMVAKLILPTFGGSPQVWSASVLFFQITLLLGYLYAHRAPHMLGLRRQSRLHVLVLALAAISLPFSIHTALFRWVQTHAAGSDATTPLWVIVALGILVGLPFLILSSGSSLLQRWFSHTDDPAAKDPYFLYSASNIGSLLGLFAYPFVLEPRLTLTEQSRVWLVGYIVLLACVAACVYSLRNVLPESEAVEEASEPESGAARPRLLWTMLAAVPSSLMLGVTTYLTSNVAPVPLLWVVPLALYLLTFVLAFSKLGSQPLPTLGRALPLVATPLAVAIILDVFPSVLAVPLGLIHLAVFFVAAWMCHTRLAASRPDPRHLTEFYFYIALGGAIGGAFNSLVAPLVFNNYHEYPLALVAACLLRPQASKQAPNRLDWIYPAVVGALMVVLILMARTGSFIPIANRLDIAPPTFRTIVTIGVPLVLCFVAVDRVARFGLSLGAVFLVAILMRPTADSAVLLTVRSFFGVHRVTTPDGRFYRLIHGNTIHGMQDRQHPEVPLTYYHPTGPIGQLFSGYEGRIKDVALVGLGVGSLAAYGQPGMRMTYYEIDPAVERIARNDRFFTFLRDSASHPDVVLGDARLTLARSDRKFDLIALDAFSSDSIPVHLLTREAMAMYVDHLKPHGMIAFHISNRYLQLEEVLAATGRSLNLSNLYQLDPALPAEMDAGKTASTWMVFARSEADLKTLAGTNGAWGPQEPAGKPWTDDFSNVLSVFYPEE